MNKRRRREGIAAEQARPTRPVELLVRFELRDLGIPVLDQAVALRRPERIAHAGIDEEMVRRLHENSGRR